MTPTLLDRFRLRTGRAVYWVGYGLDEFFYQISRHIGNATYWLHKHIDNPVKRKLNPPRQMTPEEKIAALELNIIRARQRVAEKTALIAEMNDEIAVLRKKIEDQRDAIKAQAKETPPPAAY